MQKFCKKYCKNFEKIKTMQKKQYFAQNTVFFEKNSFSTVKIFLLKAQNKIYYTRRTKIIRKLKKIKFSSSNIVKVEEEKLLI